MPIETRSRTTTTTTKPITPTLSSNLRTRPAFTPRLAGSGPVSPASTTQRSLRQLTLSPERDENGNTQPLSSNVTPRSGARNSRIEFEPLTTPDNTGNISEKIVGNPKEIIGTVGPVETLSSIDSPVQSPKPIAHRLSGGSATSQVKSAGKFFRADDVKTTPTATKPALLRTKTTESSRGVSPKLSPRKIASGSDSGSDKKFFYANNVTAPLNRASRPTVATKLFPTASTQSLPTLGNRTFQTANTRSPKDTTPINTVNSPGQPISASKPKSPSTINSPSTLTERRRSSSLNVRPFISNSPVGHRKSFSASTVSINSHPVTIPTEKSPAVGTQRVAKPQPEAIVSQHPSQTTSPIYKSPRSNSFASTNSIERSDRSGYIQIKSPISVPPSPAILRPRTTSDSTPVQSAIQAQLEAAANARRERKVLDLEISNSSLLAINKTLEKELRKQNAELRRFRRLSRSGRLSLIPSDRNFSGLSALSLATVDESEIDSAQPVSPGSSVDEFLDGDDDYDDGASDEGSSFTESSGAMRRRARDEKRLLLDLQRHQQILIDSQKLTQSIQRCLNCTDELIKDGTKALAYQVGAEDVKIGGRVLSNDDEVLSEVDFNEYSQPSIEPRHGLLSPGLTMNRLEEASTWFKGLQSIGSSNKSNSIETNQGSQLSNLTQSPSPTLSPVILPEESLLSQ